MLKTSRYQGTEGTQDTRPTFITRHAGRGGALSSAPQTPCNVNATEGVLSGRDAASERSSLGGHGS